MKNKALIVMCENQLNLDFFKDHLIIGVERGCLDLINKKIKIDYAVSDFDHVLDQEYELIKSKVNQIIKLNPSKDYLDGIEAIEFVKKQNINDICVVLKPSKRMDMNLSIIELIRDYNVKILNDNSVAFLVEKGNKNFEFNKYQDYSYVSFIALDDAIITISGFEYEVTDLELKKYNTRAFSNSFIPYKDGIIKTNQNLIVIFSK